MIENTQEFNSYELSRNWFDWCFENPEKITPTHTAMYFFIIEHCNRLGWKKKFGLPMEMTKDAIGIKNYRTYYNAFNDLIEWGFILLLEKSKNQYSANIIALVKNTKASTKALSKATQKHSQKQVHGIVGIDKPITIEPINQETIYIKEKEVFEKLQFELHNCHMWHQDICRNNQMNIQKLKQYLTQFCKKLQDEKDFYKETSEYQKYFARWLKVQIEKDKDKAVTSGFNPREGLL